jgi:site-specific DNA-methyltransferase (adenine-specific)
VNVQTVPISTLSLDPANVRRHPERNMDAIMGSLKRFGQQKPIVVDAKGVVIAGNGTLAAAKQLGWKEIAVVRSDLIGSDATAFAIADNRAAELAEWDDDALAKTLAALQIEDEELAKATGFDDADIDAMLAPAEVTEDEVPEPPVDPITKPGDLWNLGEHRLLCGDSTKDEDVSRLMRGKKVDSVVTDPPYGMSFQSNHRKVQHKEISGDANEDLLMYAIAIDAMHSRYIWCRWDNIPKTPKPKSVITWAKNNWSMGDLEHEHARQTEVCLFYPGKMHKWPDHRPTDLVTHSRTGNDLHPTQKPISLLVEVIGWTIGLVYDPFLGSGTTLIAAEQLGRKCYGMEISPAYCDVIVKRWETLTGKKAVLETR